MEGRALHYSMCIRWDPQDNIYVVTVPELPGCMSHGATYEEAVTQGQEAIDTWIEGEDPVTLPAPHYYASDEESGPLAAQSHQHTGDASSN